MSCVTKNSEHDFYSINLNVHLIYSSCFQWLLIAKTSLPSTVWDQAEGGLLSAQKGWEPSPFSHPDVSSHQVSAQSPYPPTPSTSRIRWIEEWDGGTFLSRLDLKLRLCILPRPLFQGFFRDPPPAALWLNPTWCEQALFLGTPCP